MTNSRDGSRSPTHDSHFEGSKVRFSSLFLTLGNVDQSMKYGFI